MTTRRNKMSKRRRDNKGTRRPKKAKWITAIQAGEKTLETTKSLTRARESLRSQALLNARKLFGSIGKNL